LEHAKVSLVRHVTRVHNILAVYGVSHFFADACCAALLTDIRLAGIYTDERVAYLYILYNFLAFAAQVPLGLIADALGKPRHFAAAGICLLVVSIVMISLNTNGLPPEVVVLTAGIGNAMFHLGGGVVSLSLDSGRAAAPGIFVAPGAVGLFAGYQLAASGMSGYTRAAAAIAGCVLASAVYRAECPEIVRPGRAVDNDAGLGLLLCPAVFFILGSIAVRSMLGLSFPFPWKGGSPSGAFMLALAAGSGKALGGFLADRFGFIRTCVTALLLSIPLLAAGAAHPAAGIAGCALFQMTMPVTLLACVDIFRGLALSFGMTCLAIFCGALPVLLGVEIQPLLSPAVTAASICLSAICLGVGLRLLRCGNSEKTAP
jgi:FSR family fosmidomycin resistance protein-like MFS transporter